MSWSQRGTDLLGQHSNDGRGSAVTINDNASLIAIGWDEFNDGGSASDLRKGKVRIYSWNGSDYVSVKDINGSNNDSYMGSSTQFNRGTTTVASGKYIVCGARRWNNNTGYVEVYENTSGTTWSQRGQRLDGTTMTSNGSQAAGSSVSISADGSRIAIGSEDGEQFNDLSQNIVENAGWVKVFQYNSSTSQWALLGNTMYGGQTGERLGKPNNVVLNDAGDVVAMGAGEFDTGVPSNTNSGRVLVYKYNSSNNTWENRTPNGLRSFIDLNDAQYGYSVALNGTGDLLAVGRPFSSSGTRVFVYQWNGSEYVLRDQIQQAETSDQTGFRVALNKAGNILAVSSNLKDVSSATDAGYVRIYEYQTNQYALINTINGAATGDNFGYALALTSSGNHVIASARNKYTEVYQYSGTFTTGFPSAPTITSLDTLNSAIRVNFTAPSGSSITNYKYSLNGGSFVSAGTTSNPFTISGLTNGTSYSVRILASNVFGDGDISNTVSITLANAPSAPTISSVTRGNGTLTVLLSGAPSNGGSAITNYEYSLNSGSNWTAVSPASTSLTINISGLTNGTTYPIAVRAVNVAGGGTASSVVNGKPFTTPSAVTTASVESRNQSVRITFTAPSNGGDAITNYQYTLDGSLNWISFSPVQTSSPLTITGLTNGQTYSVGIRAVNSAGTAPNPASYLSAFPVSDNIADFVAFGGGNGQSIYNGIQTLSIANDGDLIDISSFVNFSNISSANKETARSHLIAEIFTKLVDKRYFKIARSQIGLDTTNTTKQYTIILRNDNQ
jgi:hypothetical protein